MSKIACVAKATDNTNLLLREKMLPPDVGIQDGLKCRGIIARDLVQTVRNYESDAYPAEKMSRHTSCST